MKEERDSGIEVLRIFAIFMVIGVHIFAYGGYFKTACENTGLVWSSAHFMRLFFRPAVDIFVIITGYFMVHIPFDLKKSYARVLSVYGVVYFYSLLLGAVVLSNQTVFDTEDTVQIIIAKMLLPLFSQRWYFLTDYILLCLFVPFINIILQKITKKEYRLLLVLLTLVVSIWPCLSNMELTGRVIRDYGFEGLMNGKNIYCFIYVYIFGGYIGLYGKRRKIPQFFYLIAAIFCVGVNYFIWTRFDKILIYEDVAMSYLNPLVVMTAVFALSFFKDLHFHSYFVNILAGTTIGIYALHEMEYIRDFIWNKINFQEMDCSNLGINLMRIVLVMLMIFLTGAAIELLRQFLFWGIGILIKGRNTK